jgi:hypothetical protein
MTYLTLSCDHKESTEVFPLSIRLLDGGSPSAVTHKSSHQIFNVSVTVSLQQGPRRRNAMKSVSIDFGWKDFFTLRDGHVIASGRNYR